MQRRVGQHHAEVGAARRDRRRDAARPAAAGRRRSAARARAAAPPRPAPRSTSAPRRVDVGGHERERAVLAVLARAQRRDRRLVAAPARQVEAAEALDGDDPPRAQRRGGGPHRVGGARQARRRRRRAAPTGRSAGHAFGWAWKRRSRGSSYSAWHAGAHREAGHRRQRPVVRDAADDREARPAVRAVDERVAVAAVGRVARARPGTRRTWRCRARRARRARRGGRSRRSRKPRSPARGATAVQRTRLDDGQRRRLARQALDEALDRGAARPRPRAPRRARR